MREKERQRDIERERRVRYPFSAAAMLLSAASAYTVCVLDR